MVSPSSLYGPLLLCVFAATPIVMAALLLVVAPYGRHERPRRSKGFGLDPRLAWFAMETPALVSFTWAFLAGRSPDGPTAPLAWLFFGLWWLHYGQRALVEPWLRRVRTGSRTPVTIAISGALFCAINGTTNGFFLTALAPHLDESWLVDPRFVAGISLFVVGFSINRHADLRLHRLRGADRGDYSIPRGGLFRLVSCPNYLGEILEWAGFACAAWSPPALAFTLFSVANLLPRALAHHGWYRRNFPDYPAERKALVPYLL